MTTQITTHILDTSRGTPAVGVPVRLYRREPGRWIKIATTTTDTDGRAANLTPAAPPLPAGKYRLRFDSGTYYAATGQHCFYPRIEVIFQAAADTRYHVPLLLSPFGYSTYRGS